MPDQDSSITQAAQLLLAARHAVALVGAGMSVESGVPPFRGPGGLWTRLGEPSMTGYQEFLADPKGWWEQRLRPREPLMAEFQRRLEEARPNPGHRALAELERLDVLKQVITQNVDGLQQMAGSTRVAEIHGSRLKLRCVQCVARFPREAVPLDVLPPRCPRCGGIVKPDGVSFGEPIPPDVLQVCQEQAKRSDVMLVIGTSALVYPAAGLAYGALERGTSLIEVNADNTPLTTLSHVVLRGLSGQVLPVLVQRLKQLQDTA